MSSQLSAEVDKFLTQFSAPQIKLANKIRKVITKALPGVPESIKFGGPFFYPYCYLMIKPKAIIVGLIYGTALTDPAKRLQGKQKIVRHYIISSAQEIDSDYLAMLLEESVELKNQGYKPF